MNYANLFKVKSHNIPIFLACDDKYVKYMMVTIQSIISHTSIKNNYYIHILHNDICEANQKLVNAMATPNVFIKFVDVSEQIKKIEKKIAIRDYYTFTTYYRIFIPEMFPEYDKVLYIDSDTIVMDDIANLYSYNLGENYIGAITDYLVEHVEVFGEYAEKVLEISRASYFNAGVVLINSYMFRKKNIEKAFIDLLNTYTFVVAQDQDYLNILCKNKVLWIDSRWNIQMSEPEERPFSDLKLIHFNFAQKPWNHKDCRYAEYFWNYAKITSGYKQLLKDLDNFSEKDAQREKESGDNLIRLAYEEIENPENYYHKIAMQSAGNKLSRDKIIKKIEQLEKEGRFDEDVEADPPGRTLHANEVDYLRQKYSSRLRTRYAFRVARLYLSSLIKKKQFVIKGYEGLENMNNLNSGAIITCNHFSALDSFAMQMVYEKSTQRHKRKLFRIIKEGNYTSFPGFYGFLMRNCNTLPLSQSKDTMRKFMKAVDRILQKGHFILVYPEQSMWWNYRKPKPLKKGGYTFAVKNQVPVLPIFITMEDTDILDSDNYPVQAYTIHVGAPIYPDKRLSNSENAQMMMQKNADFWQQTYEKAYGVPLEYSCTKDKLLGFYNL